MATEALTLMPVHRGGGEEGKLTAVIRVLQTMICLEGNLQAFSEIPVNFEEKKKINR